MSERKTVATARRERLAHDWRLVLAAAGVTSAVERRGPEWDVIVDAVDADRAAEALAAYDAEMAWKPARVDGYGRTWAGAGMSLLLVLAFWLAGSRAVPTALFRAGEARAGTVVAEPWRIVTALTLHADAPHLVANVATGALVATAVCAAVGPGVGSWLLLLAGATGNWIAGMLAVVGYRAVGASTAIFGGIGVLVGLAMVRRPRRAWMPLAAGLALLGFLGTGERADLLAHFFGFLVGVLGGGAIAPAPVLRSRPVQWSLALAALGVVCGCWLLAIAHAPRA